MGKLVAGVGINDADYAVVRFEECDSSGKRVRKWICPYYRAWSAMLNRCYRSPGSKIYEAYKDTTVDSGWYTFSNFKKWMEEQEWYGLELDKDLLTDENKYSPTTCIFIPQWLNCFITGDVKTENSALIGIYKEEGYYKISGNKKKGWYAESFLDVKDAINKYHIVRVNYIAKSDLDDEIKNMAIKFFDRKKTKHLSVVTKFPEEFTNRGFPIQGHQIPKVGDRFKTRKGYWYTVKEVNGCENIIVEFDDGAIKKVRHTRIKDGSIRKPSIEDPFLKIIDRINALFKFNNHGLISGIQRYHSGYYGVPYKDGGKGKYFYTKNIAEALEFREKIVLKLISKFTRKNPEYLTSAKNYFLDKWAKEVSNIISNETC